MPTDTIKELTATRARLAELEASLAHEMKKELAALSAQYGFASTKAFVRAVKAACGVRPALRKGRRKPGRSRATITDAIRAQVKKMAASGRTGAEIAAAVGISVPSVQNIKKALGLVKRRKK